MTQNIAPGDHRAYLSYALDLARKSPPKPTNFCVGAVLVNSSDNTILADGYTLELPGNTHAEQCALDKFYKGNEQLPEGTVLYTTMEPCNFRASGNAPCVERILQTWASGKPGIATVYSGVREPEKFVGENQGRARLEKAGIKCVYVDGLGQEILDVATAGHETPCE